MSDNIGQLKMSVNDGKMRLTDVTTIKRLLRLIQSVFSLKAEPFKQWWLKWVMKELNMRYWPMIYPRHGLECQQKSTNNIKELKKND